ncbi:pilus assembly protein PilM [Pontiellaceae bacterium B12227]|nr:pilus assembly protein PilM [Pontiellaceae bacterium B12227]
MFKKANNEDRTQTRFSDLIGVDFSTTSTKVVRLKQGKGGISLTGLDLLPPVDFSSDPSRLQLSRNFSANYCCLAYTGAPAVVRMINTNIGEREETLPELKIRELLNVTEEFRVSAQLIKRGQGRQDSSFLAAAIPDADVEYMMDLFPSGPPAPASLEVSGLSFISAFLHARGEECADSTVCLLDTGETISHFIFLTNGLVTLVGKMPFGAKMLRKKVADDLGLDEELAASILSDASINISSSISDLLAPFIKQLTISKDFIERHQGCRISRIYISGGLSLLPSWGAEVGQMLGGHVSNWSPLENIEYDSGNIPDEMIKQATRFSGAIGAAIGGIEVS